MYSAESIRLAKQECRCCPECSDYPCEGSLNWDVSCDREPCVCGTDEDEDIFIVSREPDPEVEFSDAVAVNRNRKKSRTNRRMKHSGLY